MKRPATSPWQGFLRVTATSIIIRFLVLSQQSVGVAHAFTVVLAGGTGPVGQAVATQLDETADEVILLTRNSFLASAPNRVTEEFGFVGKGYLEKYAAQGVRLLDWDGGDLLDIVGQDWIGWQQDALEKADVVVHLVGGYTQQRTMACERLVRESFQFNKDALQVTVSPTEESLGAVAPVVAKALKRKRIEECEEMVKANCLNVECVRIDAYQLEKSSNKIVQVIQDWKKKSTSS